jgi:hypothetical protein
MMWTNQEVTCVTTERVTRGTRTTGGPDDDTWQTETGTDGRQVVQSLTDMWQVCLRGQLLTGKVWTDTWVNHWLTSGISPANKEVPRGPDLGCHVAPMVGSFVLYAKIMSSKF